MSADETSDERLAKAYTVRTISEGAVPIGAADDAGHAVAIMCALLSRSGRNLEVVDSDGITIAYAETP